MSLLNFTFSRLWTKKGTKAEGGFPTYEADEATVRSDLQQLFDELADCLNNLLSAKTIPVSAGSTTSIADSISNIVSKGVTDDSVFNKAIQDGAVTRTKILDGEVTHPKLSTDAVDQTNMQDNSVGTAELIDESVTADKMAANSVSLEETERSDGTTKKTVTGVLPVDNGGTGVETLEKLWAALIALTGVSYLPESLGGTNGTSLLTQMLAAEKGRDSAVNLVFGAGPILLRKGVHYGTATEKAAIEAAGGAVEGRVFFTLIEDEE